MHSIYRAFAVSFIVAVGGLFAFTGCSSGGGGSCEKACEFSTKCAGGMVSGDISQFCSLACTASDSQASTAGCSTQYDAYNSCLGGLDASDPTKCATETAKCATQAADYTKCYSDFCTKDPTKCTGTGG